MEKDLKILIIIGTLAFLVHWFRHMFLDRRLDRLERRLPYDDYKD
jgi:hypothetical protein